MLVLEIAVIARIDSGVALHMLGTSSTDVTWHGPTPPPGYAARWKVQHTWKVG